MFGSCHVSAGNCDQVLCMGIKCSCPLRCFSSSERRCLSKCRDSSPNMLMVKENTKATWQKTLKEKKTQKAHSIKVT